MRRRLLNFLALLSLLLCIAAAALWVRSSVRVDDLYLRTAANGGGFTGWQFNASRGDVGMTVEVVRFPSGTDAAAAGAAADRGGYSNGIGVGAVTRLISNPHSVSPFALDPPRPIWDLGLPHGGVTRSPSIELWGVKRVSLDRWSANIPLWCFVVLFAALPVDRLVRRLKQRLSPRPGVCHACGYDLRATPDRCPECGTSVTSLSSA